MMDVIRFDAVKVAMKQDATGYVLTLRIHPDEVPEELLRHFVGAHYDVAMIRTDVQAITGPNLVQLAGMLCRNQDFFHFLGNEMIVDISNEQEATEALREYLQIQTRKELQTNKEAANKLIKLNKDFQSWKRN